MKLLLTLPFALLLACQASHPGEQPGRPGPDGTVAVQATEEGFTPSRIEVKAGIPVKLVFRRDVEKTCMTGVNFPTLGIKKDLPLHTPVTVEVTPVAGGIIAFECPMQMGKGAVVTLPES